MKYNQHPEVMAVIDEIVAKFKSRVNNDDIGLKYGTVWKDIPAELLDDLPSFSNYLDRGEMIEIYEGLLKNNELNPEMYHPAIRFSNTNNDNFIKNRISVFIYAELNQPQTGNEN